MKRYAVVFEDSAQADVRESYDWGRRKWSKHEAQQWIRQLRRAVSARKHLTQNEPPIFGQILDIDVLALSTFMVGVVNCPQGRNSYVNRSTQQDYQRS